MFTSLLLHRKNVIIHLLSALSQEVMYLNNLHIVLSFTVTSINQRVGVSSAVGLTVAPLLCLFCKRSMNHFD